MTLAPTTNITLGRRLWRRVAGRVGITLRFLIVSFVVVALAMLTVGTLVSRLVGQSIVEGVAITTAARVDSILSNLVGGMVEAHDLSTQNRAQLDQFFEISSDADSTRLIQVR